jgi:hypothetical protein
MSLAESSSRWMRSRLRANAEARKVSVPREIVPAAARRRIVTYAP